MPRNHATTSILPIKHRFNRSIKQLQSVAESEECCSCKDIWLKANLQGNLNVNRRNTGQIGWQM